MPGFPGCFVLLHCNDNYYVFLDYTDVLNVRSSGSADPMAHVEAVCAPMKLGVIFYNRDNAILNESTIERLWRQ
jgi:hypothetical protein